MRAKPQAAKCGVALGDVFGGDVEDEGVGAGAAFGLVDAVDGGGVGGVGAEAVDGFGGEGDEVALLEELDCLVDLVHAVSLAFVWRCWGLM